MRWGGKVWGAIRDSVFFCFSNRNTFFFSTSFIPLGQKSFAGARQAKRGARSHALLTLLYIMALSWIEHEMVRYDSASRAHCSAALRLHMERGLTAGLALDFEGFFVACFFHTFYRRRSSRSVNRQRKSHHQIFIVVLKALDVPTQTHSHTANHRESWSVWTLCIFDLPDWPRYFWNKTTFSTCDDRVKMLEVISHVAGNLKWKCRKLNDCSGIDGQFVFILQEQSGASMRPRSAELWLHIMSFISPLSSFFFYWKKAQRL